MTLQQQTQRLKYSRCLAINLKDLAKLRSLSRRYNYVYDTIKLIDKYKY